MRNILSALGALVIAGTLVDAQIALVDPGFGLDSIKDVKAYQSAGTVVNLPGSGLQSFGVKGLSSTTDPAFQLYYGAGNGWSFFTAANGSGADIFLDSELVTLDLGVITDSLNYTANPVTIENFWSDLPPVADRFNPDTVGYFFAQNTASSSTYAFEVCAWTDSVGERLRLLDVLEVVPAPEPAMIGGIAALGLVLLPILRRRRRK